MATIETNIDVNALNESGKRGHELVKWAYEVLRYDGEKLVHTAVYAGTPPMLITSAVQVCSVIAFPRCATGAVKAMDQYNQSELTADLIGVCVTYATC